jgi:hypothetical protein
MRVVLAACLLIGGALGTGACGDDEAGSTPQKKKTPAEAFCEEVEARVTRCGPATPCDDALVADCADLAGVLSDGYLAAATSCLKAGGTVTACLQEGLGGLSPTDAHRAFAAQFCGECLLGVPGCEDAFFTGDGSDASLAGNVVIPFGDGLVDEIAATCATGLTCLATFSSCAQQVLVGRALPDNVAKCMLDQLLGTAPAPAEGADQCPDGAGGADGGTGSGGAPAGGGTGGVGPCATEPTGDACYSCCIDANFAGYEAYVVHVLNECACQIGASCQAACDAECSGATPANPCIECVNALEPGTPCHAEAATLCENDPACVPLFDCSDECPR